MVRFLQIWQHGSLGAGYAISELGGEGERCLLCILGMYGLELNQECLFWGWS